MRLPSRSHIISGFLPTAVLSNGDTPLRVERTDHPQFQTCWLTTDEDDQLRRTTDSYRDELVVRFGGEVGLRSFEVPQITPTPPA